MTTSARAIDTPIGQLTLVVEEAKLIACVFSELQERTCYNLAELASDNTSSENTVVLDRAEAALLSYFSGNVKALKSIPLRLNGSAFQRAVWEELCEIPVGETLSYADVALAVGSPNAARAVGNACNVNSLCVFVPCHRVIASNGTMGGYAGGLEVKEALLAIEKRAKSLSSHYMAAA